MARFQNAANETFSPTRAAVLPASPAQTPNLVPLEPTKSRLPPAGLIGQGSGMISASAAEALDGLACAVLFVAVIDLDTKEHGLGTAFHLGGGYLVTAYHVIKNKRIDLIGRSDLSRKTNLNPDRTAIYSTTHGGFEAKGDQVDVACFDEETDVAILKLKGNVPIGRGYPAEKLQPAVRLSPFTDIVTEGEFLMTEVIVLGFPRIPNSQPHPPSLVAYRGDISATTMRPTNQRRHFIITGMARGGFSGGPVFILNGPLLHDYKFPHQSTSGTIAGVVVESSIEADASGGRDGTREELGFVTAISAQAIIDLLKLYNLTTNACLES